MFRFPSVVLECPVCGRPVEVREEYAGKLVHCNHCRGGFLADRDGPEPAGGSLPTREFGQSGHAVVSRRGQQAGQLALLSALTVWESDTSKCIYRGA